MLVAEYFYAAGGQAKYIADFLADRLCRLDPTKRQLFQLASFIFREAGKAVSGVVPTAEMDLIYNGNRAMEFYGPGTVTDLQKGIPDMADSIYSPWKDNAKLPEWWSES